VSSMPAPEEAATLRPDHRLVFVGGLHRSGTTPLARVLAAHPQVSGFENTGATEDEGQHLQDVYRPARAFGGAGRFAVDPLSHLTETSPLVTPANARRLFTQWQRYWDLSRPYLVEKSPPNLVMTRFLQALFPEAFFVVIVRHPVVVALSTEKWLHGRTLRTPMANWFAAHETFLDDSTRLHRVHVVKYEHLVEDASSGLAAIAAFLGLDGALSASLWQGNRSVAYEQRWAGMAVGASTQRWVRARLIARYTDRARAFGYDLENLDVAGAWPAPAGGA